MKNKIITLIIAILIILLGYWYLTKTDVSTSYLVVDTKTADSMDAKYIYNILQKMSQVTLDDSIFSSNAFQSLKDNTATLATQLVGRNNPFAPTGNDISIPGQTIQSVTASSSLRKQ